MLEDQQDLLLHLAPPANVGFEGVAVCENNQCVSFADIPGGQEVGHLQGRGRAFEAADVELDLGSDHLGSPIRHADLDLEDLAG